MKHPLIISPRNEWDRLILRTPKSTLVIGKLPGDVWGKAEKKAAILAVKFISRN